MEKLANISSILDMFTIISRLVTHRMIVGCTRLRNWAHTILEDLRIIGLVISGKNISCITVIRFIFSSGHQLL